MRVTLKRVNTHDKNILTCLLYNGWKCSTILHYPESSLGFEIYVILYQSGMHCPFNCLCQNAKTSITCICNTHRNCIALLFLKYINILLTKYDCMGGLC